ncbi:MAG: 2-amino-4-hydroxy-6-hydroxymethyldihydropteridine diphosphokinase [Candidatus Pelagibacter sp.]
MKRQDILENQVSYAYLALGSNLGKKIKNLDVAKNKLSEIGINIIKSSSFYLTKSWPNTKFPDFVNSVILVKTNYLLPELFKQIKLIEQSLGRKKTPKNYPRICDIDIIDFNGNKLVLKFNNQNIEVPHFSMHKRNFVLIPLFEINQTWIHPKSKKNIVKLLSELPNDDLRRIKIA